MENGKEAATEWLYTNHPVESFVEQIEKPIRGCSDTNVEVSYIYMYVCMYVF